MLKVKKALLFLFIFSFATLSYFTWNKLNKSNLASPANSILAPAAKPWQKYTIEILTKTEIKAGQIEIGDVITTNDTFSSRYIYLSFDPEINSGKIRKVSGAINLPNKPGTYPVIIMMRGYVDKENYNTGIGTQKAGEHFARNGFITIAPDFLGYGLSDPEAENSIESRFQTYTTVLTLLASIKNLNYALSTDHYALQSDHNRIALWGHSNGGQIVLTILEITGKQYPTVLWAPVSKPFPYSILYYTDDFDDHGKALRRVIANFEKDYDVELYSLANYIDKIEAPIQLHQGSADDSVPQKWSDQLTETLKKFGKDAEYFVYQGADHNLLGGWNLAAQRSLNFYIKNLGN